MNRIILLFLSLFIFACGSPETSESPEATAAEEAPAMEMSEADFPMSGPNYNIAKMDDEPASPRMEMTGTVGGSSVKVNYGSPSVKGRAIWGSLEPYDKVWRAGANEATRVTFDKDVMVEGKALAAGTYSYFVIPSDGAWTVIFNKQPEQWGAFNYVEDQDALRVETEPVMLDESQDALHYYIDGDDLVMRWEKVALPVTVTSAG